jgi:hypothetical protein
MACGVPRKYAVPVKSNLKNGSYETLVLILEFEMSGQKGIYLAFFLP